MMSSPRSVNIVMKTVGLDAISQSERIAKASSIVNVLKVMSERSASKSSSDVGIAMPPKSVRSFHTRQSGQRTDSQRMQMQAQGAAIAGSSCLQVAAFPVREPCACLRVVSQ